MKKFLAILLSLLLILSTAACGAADPASVSESVPESSEVPEESSEPSAEPTEESSEVSDESSDEVHDLDEFGEISTDENLLTVDVTFSSSFFVDEDMSNFDPEAYAKENNFIAAKLNDDGSLTVTMTKSQHKAVLADTTRSLDESLDDYVNSEENAHILDIDHNEDFTEYTVTVDKELYENSFDLTSLMLAMCSGMYQMLIDIDEPHAAIEFVDGATGEVINTINLPEDLE